MGSKPKVQTDYLIIGQGIAGSLIALNLLQRGRSVAVVDDGHKHSASKVAAGLINPITGRRHVLTWRFQECWKFLQEDYPRWEVQLGEAFFHKKPLLRFLKTQEERVFFEQKLCAGDFGCLDIDYPWDTGRVVGLLAQEPCYRLHQTGFVNQNAFILSARTWLKQQGCLIEDQWSHSDFSRDSGKVSWKRHEAKRIIFTQGFKNDTNPFFRDLPFRHAKGELLELKGPEVEKPPVLNRGKWLLPLSPGRYRAGATYDLKQIDLSVSNKGKEEILEALKELVDWDFEVTKHQSGVRPAVHDFRPVLGRHPWYPELIIFNGLGSKGSLQAPLLAKELTEYLEDDERLHHTCDVERFRKYL